MKNDSKVHHSKIDKFGYPCVKGNIRRKIEKSYTIQSVNIKLKKGKSEKMTQNVYIQRKLTTGKTKQYIAHGHTHLQ